MNSAPAFRALGTSDEGHTCDVCGREELRRVVKIVALDADGNPDGEVFHAGTTCAARITGWTLYRVRKEAARADGDRKARERLAAKRAQDARTEDLGMAPGMFVSFMDVVSRCGTVSDAGRAAYAQFTSVLTARGAQTDTERQILANMNTYADIMSRARTA